MHRSPVALACMAVVVIMALLIPLVGCGGGGPTVPCKISSVSGDVQILRSGSTESVKATNDMELGVGDTITTGSDESTNLIFFDGSHMEIKANSEILVKELSTASTGSTSVSLRQNIGRTINRVNKLIDSGSRYKVETPSGVTLVKGTIFEVLVLQSGDTTVKAEEGSVLFTASGVTVTVNQGFLSSASVGGTPSTPTPTPTATVTPAETPASTPTISSTPTATVTTAETPASTPTISSTPTATVTPAETLASTPTPTSTQPTQNGAIPQELIGVWKSDCGVHVGNQSRTIAWTLKDSTLQMAYDLWDSDSSCGDPSKNFENFVMTWETNLVTQNTNGSYQVTATLIAETVTEVTQYWVDWANEINFYEYNDWQVGVSKDVLGRLRQPGASSPEPNKGTQYDLLLKVDGDKLSIDLPGLNEVIYTKQ